MAKVEVYSAVDACLNSRRPLLLAPRATCPGCHGNYEDYGMHGGVVDELSGMILCEVCALRNILEDNRVCDLAEALELKYIQPEDIDDYE